MHQSSTIGAVLLLALVLVSVSSSYRSMLHVCTHVDTLVWCPNTGVLNLHAFIFAGWLDVWRNQEVQLGSVHVTLQQLES